MPKQNGFTLMEILISLSIIAIITAVAVSSALTAQKNSRDAQRRADLRIIQGALQKYYADNNFFPGDSEVNANFGQPLKSRDASPNTKTYLSVTPSDPSGSPNYCYISMPSTSTTSPSCDSSSTTCQYYSLCAMLESPDPAEIASPLCSCGSTSNYNFRVNPP